VSTLDTCAAAAVVSSRPVELESLFPSRGAVAALTPRMGSFSVPFEM
jgi:hypothetical protein